MGNISKKEWSNIYSNANKIFGNDKNFSFMNHGFFPIHKNVSNNTPFKAQESLYLFLFDMGIKFGNRIGKKISKVLEVGCGRGGGAAIINKIYNIEKIYACDYSSENIHFAKKFFPEIEFLVCDAENLSYGKDFFDLIMNVESSHCYDNIRKFFQGAQFSLNKDGLMLYADIFYKDDVENITKIILEYFDILHFQDISNNVLKSCIYTQGAFQGEALKSEKHGIIFNISKEKYYQYLSGNYCFLFFILKSK